MTSHPPRILVDALSARVGGGITYITQQLAALEELRPHLSLQVLASPFNEKWIKNATTAEVRIVRTPNLITRLLYEQIVLPVVASKADLLYCPANFCPLVPIKTPVILTLRNAHHFGEGKALPHGQPARKKVEIRLAQMSARSANIVISVSEYLRTQLIADGVDPGKIHVVPSGLPKLPTESLMPSMMEGVGEFVVSIANDHKIKRLDDLVLAWCKAFQDAPSPPALVLAGSTSPQRIEDHAQLIPQHLRHRLIHLGSVSDRRMIKWLLIHAKALVSTSELESFGFTAIEAGSVGCPVILTRIPAHLETARGNSEFFEIGDLEHLSAALRRNVVSTAPRVAWSWEHSWERNAASLVALIEAALTRSKERPSSN